MWVAVFNGVYDDGEDVHLADDGAQSHHHIFHKHTRYVPRYQRRCCVEKMRIKKDAKRERLSPVVVASTLNCDRSAR